MGIVNTRLFFEPGFSANQAGADMLARSMLPQYTVCCVNGSAMGGGVGLICNCDYVVAVKSAHVSLSEVKLGVIPAVISPHVVRTIGTSNARRLFTTAENCNMQTCQNIGMVHRIVDPVDDFP